MIHEDDLNKTKRIEEIGGKCNHHDKAPGSTSG